MYRLKESFIEVKKLLLEASSDMFGFNLVLL